MRKIFFALLFMIAASVQAAYKPEGAGITTVNGNHRFTRAIYGTNTPFRFETSDYPEIGMYMPNMGGSAYFAVKRGGRVKWIKDLHNVKAIYEAGKREYIIRDEALLGNGSLHLSFLALSNADGMIGRITSKDLPSDAQLVMIYGGASDEHFYREGDIGADKPDCFYISTKKSTGNQYECHDHSFTLTYNHKHIIGILPAQTVMKVADANQLDHLDSLTASTGSTQPVLLSTIPLSGEQYFILANPETCILDILNNPVALYKAAEAFRRSIADKVKLDTPDSFINPTGSNLAIAANAVWQAPTWLHGSIGWRIPLLGWRHCYIGDFLGWRDRSRSHFDYYADLQSTVPITKPAIMDSTKNLARPAYIFGTPMYSNGYISNCEDNALYFYDMNMVYIDALLWHLNCTGDLNYAKKMWPVIKRHLEWEKKAFDPDDDGLYEAHCCIWASDALQYSGAKVTHSSAYNYRANKIAAVIAKKIGENPIPYELEAKKIKAAIDRELWIPRKGWWAEYKGVIGNQQLHESAAAWTIYHSIDSELSDDNFEAYQAGQYVENELPLIPVEQRNDTVLSCVASTTNWMPYEWSVNNVAFAETAHTALALFEAGMNDEAYRLMRGGVMDVMYNGKSPGNFGMTTSYDAVGEVYRDFSDAIGIYSRLLVQGLFGIYPDALHDSITIRPGFPLQWNHASLATSDYAVCFKRNGTVDSYQIKQTSGKLNLRLNVTALKDNIGSVKVNGKAVKAHYITFAGKPMLAIDCGRCDSADISIAWTGNPIERLKHPNQSAFGEPIYISGSSKLKIISCKDPQGVMKDVSIRNNIINGICNGELGARTLFVKVEQNNAIWYEPVNMKVFRPIEVVNVNAEDTLLHYQFINNTSQPQLIDYTVNGICMDKITLAAHEKSAVYTLDKNISCIGSNRFIVRSQNNYHTDLINWNISSSVKNEEVDISPYYNDNVANIFKHEYLSPRSKDDVLQMPKQGFGDWCVPLRYPSIDDSYFKTLSNDGLFHTGLGIDFSVPYQNNGNNIVYTSLWDNFPDSVNIEATGNYSHAYFLMAGSTNHMQSRFVNGIIRVKYEDGTSDSLQLTNPDSWVPIEQDFYSDNYAYRLNQPRPYRVMLKTGIVSRDLTKDIGLKGKVKRMIDGGAGVILDMPLDKSKTVKSVTLKTEAYEVIIGLMGMTFVR
jgi:hypothetical protein